MKNQILKERLYLEIDDIEHIIYIFDSKEVFSWLHSNKKVVCIFSALKGNLNIHKYLNTKIIKKLQKGSDPWANYSPRYKSSERIFLTIDPKDSRCYEKIKNTVLEGVSGGFKTSMNLDEKIKNFIKITT